MEQLASGSRGERIKNKKLPRSVDSHDSDSGGKSQLLPRDRQMDATPCGESRVTFCLGSFKGWWCRACSFP